MPSARKTLFLILLLCTAVSAGAGDSALDAEAWPGRMAPTEEMKALSGELRAAMARLDAEAITAAKTKLLANLGKYAGVPETRPEYISPPDASTPKPDRVAELWRKSFERVRGKNGWNLAAPRDAEFQTGPRLRVSCRAARAYLQTHEAGMDEHGAYLNYAIKGFDYIVSAQCSTGVFGYPYDPKGPGLKQAAARIVEQGRQEGRRMVENGWIIDDLGDGGLNFDNGLCGVVLLDAYRVTGDKRYLASARRAAEWAIDRPLVLNWNYNCFSGWLLAKLYRATSEERYLNEATRIFKYGVLPGQMSNGRWVDQHNARIQYHSVMLRSLIDYYGALKQADAPYADTVKNHIELGLDNLAAQITTYGASNVHELLSLDALCLGLSAFGDRPRWRQAVNVNVNTLCGRFLLELEKRGMPMTEAVASYLHYTRREVGETAGRAQAGDRTGHRSAGEVL